jgi:hypothetical protein
LELERVFYTSDTDLLVITAKWTAAGRDFAGVVYAAQLGVTVGGAIADLELIAKASSPDEWTNRVEHLPL